MRNPHISNSTHRMKATSTVIVFGLHCLTGATHLKSRAAESQAPCQAPFWWMQNSKNASPCQVVASVDAVCNNGNWVIVALNSSNQYPLPSGANATLCTCSWASYNLISACIACQGFPEQTPEWTVYMAGCSSLVIQKTSFFPSNVALGDEVAIPFWAQTNPTQWPSQTFDAAQAQGIASQGKPDSIGGKSTATSKKRINVDTILGAVIGLLFLMLSVCSYTIWRLRKAGQAAGRWKTHEGSVHTLAPADTMFRLSNFRSPLTAEYTPLISLHELQLPTSPASPHNSTVTSTRSLVRSTSTVSTGSSAIENRIVPFTAPMVANPNSNIERKSAHQLLRASNSPNALVPHNQLRMSVSRTHTAPRNACKL